MIFKITVQHIQLYAVFIDFTTLQFSLFEDLMKLRNTILSTRSKKFEMCFARWSTNAQHSSIKHITTYQIAITTLTISFVRFSNIFRKVLFILSSIYYLIDVLFKYWLIRWAIYMNQVLNTHCWLYSGWLSFSTWYQNTYQVWSSTTAAE